MNLWQFSNPLLGGLLIGLAVSLLLLLKGRIFGISGIVGGALLPKAGDTAWRLTAIAGLVAAGIILKFLYPVALEVETDGGFWRYVIAGLLVGFGTQLGSGCTSGHGVCGISRLSPRSIFATLTFIGSGILIVALLRVKGMVP